MSKSRSQSIPPLPTGPLHSPFHSPAPPSLVAILLNDRSPIEVRFFSNIIVTIAIAIRANSVCCRLPYVGGISHELSLWIWKSLKSKGEHLLRAVIQPVKLDSEARTH